MKKILEAILVINLTVFSCIVFINIILRYGFQTSILPIDELSCYLFVWLTLIGAIVASMDNAHAQVTLLVERLSPVQQRRAVLITHSLILFICGVLAWGTTLKIIQDWSGYSPILGLPIDLMYVACLPTSLVITFFEPHHLHQPVTHSNSLTSLP